MIHYNKIYMLSQEEYINSLKKETTIAGWRSIPRVWPDDTKYYTTRSNQTRLQAPIDPSWYTIEIKSSFFGIILSLIHI